MGGVEYGEGFIFYRDSPHTGIIKIHIVGLNTPPRSENFAAAFAKGGDWEEHVGGVFVPSPPLYYYISIFSAIVKCHSLVVTIFTNIYRF